MRTPVPIEDGIGIEYVALDVLLGWPGNPKEHDLSAIAASILRFGFRDPIGVNRRDNEIEEGHGRLEVLRYLQQRGNPPPRFIRVDGAAWLVPVLYFDDDTPTAHSYSLAHNRTQELGGGYDDERLRAALEEQARFGLLPGTGFDSDDLDALSRRIEESPVPKGFRIVVDCVNEQDQGQLLERLRAEGWNCRTQ